MRVSEYFYSIQGEGPTAGVPSLFIRLANCNFMCGGFGGELVGTKNEGSEVTWWCDTEPVWKSGTDYDTANDFLQEVFAKFEGLLTLIKERRAHIIITGGEPTLPTNMRSFNQIRQWFADRRIDPYYEIETNASIPVLYEKLFHQVNASPKLANSGMPESLRYNKKAIDLINAHPNGWFKFVVNTKDDIQEIKADWINRFGVNPKRIILMPGVDKFEDLQRTSLFAAEAAIENGWRWTTRAQVLCWDQTTGV